MRIGDLKIILEEIVYEKGQLYRKGGEITAEEDVLMLLAKMLLITINNGELSEETKNQIMKNGNEFIDTIFKINSENNSTR